MVYHACMDKTNKQAAQSIETITLTDAAQRNVEETGAIPALDLDELRSGKTTPERLLAFCANGADDDRMPGWREYVATLYSMCHAK